MTLTQFNGDSVTHDIPLAWRGEAFEPGVDWLLIWTAKEDPADPDSAAVIQKASGVGITAEGSVASVAVVPADTVEATQRVLFWDVQAQHATTGEVRTVAIGCLRLTRDVTRETTTSIPVQTTEPPYPGGNPALAIHAATAKPLIADDDEFGMADSADSWSLKKATWAAIKARLKAYFDPFYQAAGVTWSTLSGKPSTFPPIIGSGAGDAVAGNDARLSDAREWTAETVSQAEAEAGVSTARRAWTAQRVFQSIAAWWASSAAKTKLDGIATGATANSSDAVLLARANHTGSQATSTITGLDAALAGKAATAHTHASTEITDSTATGRALLTASTAAMGRSVLDAAQLNHTHVAASITDSTATGRSVLTAADAASARSAIAAAPSTGILPSAIAGTAVINADARLSDARTPTNAGLASTINAATEDTVLQGNDRVPMTETGASGALRWMTLDRLFAFVRTQLGLMTSTVQAAGEWAFQSATRPTSAGTGTPAANSLITRADAANLHRLVRLESNLTVTSTITPVTVCTLPVVAGRVYKLYARILVNGTVNTGTRHGITFPAGGSIPRITRKRASFYNPTAEAGDFNLGLAESTTLAEIEGFYVCNLSGNISTTFAQNTSHPDQTSASTYSFLELIEV